MSAAPRTNPQNSNGAQRPTIPPPDPAALVILLVDDDPDCRLPMRDALSECKVKNIVYEANSGEAALEFLERGEKYLNMPRPGLIYLDVEMPGGINGIETLRRIRAKKEFRDIPIVMMTGLCGETEMKLAAQYGANSYTLKPANVEQFLRTVLASTSYWLTIHQYPDHHHAPELCRR